MRKKLPFLAMAVLLMVQLFPAARASGVTVYVDETAAVNGTGTMASPYNSLEQAFAGVPNDGVIEIVSESAIFDASASDDYIVTLPAKNVTVNGNGKRLLFHGGGILMGGSLTINGVQLYFDGPSKEGYDRRIYANGYDLTVSNCTIGNKGSTFGDDSRGMVVLAGGLRQDIDLGGRTQHINISSGRLSALFVGGESGGGSAGKLSGDVRVSLSGKTMECSSSLSFAMAGVFAHGLSSGATLSKPTRGMIHDGVLDLEISNMNAGFQKYTGNGRSTLQISSYGYSWLTPNITGFSDLTLASVALKIPGTGLQNITLNYGGELWLTAGGTFATLTGGGGKLQIPSDKPITFTGDVIGTSSLVLDGNPPAESVSIPCVYAAKTSTGTFNHAVLSENDTQKIWSVIGKSTQAKDWRMLVEYEPSSATPAGSYFLILPDGKIPSAPRITFSVQGLTGDGKPAPISGSLELSAPYNDCVVLASRSPLIPSGQIFTQNTNLIPAGDMVVTGRAELDGVIYSDQKTLRFIVAPSLDFMVTQVEGKNYLTVSLIGAIDFEGTVAVSGDYTASQTIPSGTVVQIPLTGMAAGEHSLTVTYSPTDTDHYQSATVTKTVSIVAETPDPTPPPDPKNPVGDPTYSKITARGKILADANLSGSFKDPDTDAAVTGMLDWVDSQGAPLASTTPVKQGVSYAWRFTPADSAAYYCRTGAVVLWENSTKPDGGGSGGGGGSSSGGGGSYLPPQTVDNAPKVFLDVEGNSWYKPAVDFVSSRKLFSGVGDGSYFSPLTPMTRGMLLTVLYRHDGASDKGEGGEWYADARRWAMDGGISDGTNMTGEITREQLAVMLHRYVGLPAAAGDLSVFPDGAGVSPFALDAVRWAVRQGLLTGKGDGRLDPQGSATRAEAAAVLMRFIRPL